MAFPPSVRRTRSASATAVDTLRWEARRRRSAAPSTARARRAPHGRRLPAQVHARLLQRVLRRSLPALRVAGLAERRQRRERLAERVRRARNGSRSVRHPPSALSSSTAHRSVGVRAGWIVPEAAGSQPLLPASESLVAQHVRRSGERRARGAQRTQSRDVDARTRGSIPRCPTSATRTSIAVRISRRIRPRAATSSLSTWTSDDADATTQSQRTSPSAGEPHANSTSCSTARRARAGRVQGRHATRPEQS